MSIKMVRDDPKLLDDVGEYPNLKKEVGGSIPNCEISSLIDINLLGGQLPHVLWCWHAGLVPQKQTNKQTICYGRNLATTFMWIC